MSGSFNKVIIAGNLCFPPELKTLPSGTQVLENSIALNRTWRDKMTGEKNEEVSFIDVTFWAGTANTVSQYLSKGSYVIIEGRLKQDQWDDKETGQKRSKVKVDCERMTMVPRSAGSESGQPSQSSGSEWGEQAAAEAVASVSKKDDIPF